MKKFRLFWSIVRRCHAEKITFGFLISFFIVSLIIMICEPGIHTYGQAMWYTFVACTTIGFGDITVSTALSWILTVYMTFYEIVCLDRHSLRSHRQSLHGSHYPQGENDRNEISGQAGASDGT